MTFRRICFVLFVFIGIFMLFQSIRNILRINETENWKQTEAFVESINITKIEERHGDSFCPVIKYDYKINGINYSGDRLTLGSTHVHRSEWWAMNEVESYLDKEDSSKVLIYYDPANPGSSTISRGNTRDEYQLMYFGIVFLIIGLLANRKEMIAIIKRFREKNK